MAREMILADTGPLVALVDESDEWHQWALQTLPKLPLPLVTCEAVLVEAWFLLKNHQPCKSDLAALHHRRALRVDFDFEENAAAIYQLLEKYADVPMDFADACLVKMAEHRSDVRVWTIDPDFRIYRRNRNRPIPLIFPPGKR